MIEPRDRNPQGALEAVGGAVARMFRPADIGEEDQRAIVIPRVYLYGPLVVGFFFMGCEFLRFLVGRDSLYARGARDEERV